jgi:mono/diheme cytochrome c family protein
LILVAKYFVMSWLVLIVFVCSVFVVNAQNGQVLYQGKCAACHTIGQGKLVGPDLFDISSKREHDWLVNFIRSSQTMIKSGDPEAVAVYNAHNKILMPDAGLSDSEIESVLQYIEKTSREGGQTDQSEAAPDMLASITGKNIHFGAKIFSGEVPLKNGGQACSVCHTVKDNAVFSSGTLAKDLTLSYENMGSAGIAAILNNPPFPVMEDAYEDHSLTGEEVLDLTAYLRSVSENRYYQNSRDYTLLFVVSGLFVFFMVVSGIVILYFNRKRGSVNDEVYNRQTKVLN